MRLSVIIVNYNVRHFLEQCLFSVAKAINEKKIHGEIIVVDNASDDGSVEYLKPIFPNTRFISNKENLGFAKACNQGMHMASGEIVLFLNPDCLVPEDCFEKCILFFENHPDAGALGIRMLDGKGNYLKESKRAFPSPLTSFFKMTGFTKLFPHSKLFANYYLGHLDENKNHEAAVLAGAFMMVKKELLQKTGGFDEVFFMYGEDIDLSYRIQKTGVKNYYVADSSIIHFKGESTKKKNINYVRMFYKAMSVFVKKHNSEGKAGLFQVFIQLAIWVSASLAAIKNFIRKIGLPLIDAGLILTSFFIVKNIWNEYIKAETIYDESLLWWAFPAFTTVYLFAAYYAGLYDRWYRKVSILKSTALASLILLAAYSLLPEHLRFSRGIILFGALFSLMMISMLRWILIRLNVINASKESDGLNTLIVGSEKEFETVTGLIRNAGYEEMVLGRLSVRADEQGGLGYWKDMKDFAKSMRVKEMIFCEGELTFKEIIESLNMLPSQCSVKFHASGSRSIVGSDSKNYSGESLSHENGFKLSDPYYKRIKRLLDIIVSLFLLITFPLHIFFIKKPTSFISNCFSVLLAKKTWVGYAGESIGLPVLRSSVIKDVIYSNTDSKKFSNQSLQIADRLYAKDYSFRKDLDLIFSNYTRLGD